MSSCLLLSWSIRPRVCLVLAIIPIIVFYLVCQKYIVSGVMAGAVKG